MDFNKLPQQVSTIKVKNVINLPLLYALFFSLLGLIGSIFSKYFWIPIILFSFTAFVLLIAIFGYLYFTFKNPDYLRSEQYHFRKKSLEILGDKETPLLPGEQKIVQITNPYSNSSEE